MIFSYHFLPISMLEEPYKVNISTAVTNMRLWLRRLIGTAELMKRIKKYLAPVRPDRKYQRNMKPKSVVPFNTKAS